MPALNKDRLGNRVYRALSDKVFLISLHFPWPAKTSFKDYGYPVGGAIDLVMKELAEKRVGFDVKGSPFAKLRDDNTFFSIEHEDFTLGDFCDRYVFQKHFADYEGCKVDPQFITTENFKEAVQENPHLTC